MTDKPWESARLIPVSGINGAEEQERRGTSALLAVINAVREFGRAIIGPLGAPAGTPMGGDLPVACWLADSLVARA